MSEKETTLSYFDRAIGALDGLPDVVKTRATTLRVIPALGLGSHTYIVQTFRQREIGDSVFLEITSEGTAVRIVIPPSVADTIARQRDQLTGQVRSRVGKRLAAERMARGEVPFTFKRKGGSR